MADVVIGNVTLLHGDVNLRLSEFEDGYFNGVLTDPPYGLGFMNKKWDSPDTVAFRDDTWKNVLRVLKPGAHVLAFGGTRTVHRLAVAIEDAGFEIRDRIRYECSFETKYDALINSLNDEQVSGVMELLNDCGGLGSEIAYSFGTGFPKSHNISKAIDKSGGNRQSVEWSGYGTALKPSYEPIIVARKPLEGTVASNVIEYGVGGLDIDGTKVDSGRPRKTLTGGMGRKGNPIFGTYANEKTECFETSEGRWPANTIHDGSEEVENEYAKFGERKSGKPREDGKRGKRPVGCVRSVGKDKGDPIPNGPQYGDEGTASRFFYCAKASKKDRGEGNNHPTVKPTALTQYLATLIGPPKSDHPRRLLVPFCGSGSEIIGAMRSGKWDEIVGIELEQQYIDIAVNRIANG